LKIVVYSTIRDAYKKVFKPEGVDLIFKMTPGGMIYTK